MTNRQTAYAAAVTSIAAGFVAGPVIHYALHKAAWVGAVWAAILGGI